MNDLGQASEGDYTGPSNDQQRRPSRDVRARIAPGYSSRVRWDNRQHDRSRHWGFVIAMRPPSMTRQVALFFIARRVPSAFVGNGASTTDLGTLGGLSSSASAINDAGQVVGSAEGTIRLPCVPLGERRHDRPGALPSDQHSEARGSTKRVSRRRELQPRLSARLPLGKRDGLTELKSLGGCAAKCNGINDAGQVVGRSTTSSSTFYGVLWENGGVMPFSSLRPDLFGDSQAWHQR